MRNLTATLCLTIAVLLGSAGMSWGADYQRGLIAYSNWDYVTAFREWEPLARQGHPGAQQKLGLLYFSGQGVPQNYETALMWWKLAAKQGNLSARNGILLAEARIMPLKGWTWERKENGWGWVKPRPEKTRLPVGTPPSDFSYPKTVTPTVTAMESEPKVDQRKRLELARRTQEALQVIGLYSGKLDGIIDVITKFSIQRWQKYNGYTDTGDITEFQLSQLEQEATAHLAKKKSEPTFAIVQPQILQFLKGPVRPDDIAVIIANSNYGKLGKGIPNVTPAYTDAKNIKRYFTEALGVREGNIIYLKDATGTQMMRVFGTEKDHRGKLFNWTKPNVSKVYVYYAGHGAPAGDTGTAYLVPSDSDSETVQLTGYPLKQLYSNLGKIPAKSITVILEACFSGQSQGGYVSSMSSGISVVPRMPSTPRKITVISAGAANQVASWEKDSSQSLFTRYFLKGMSGEGDRKPYGDGNGTVSLKELKKYLDDTMTYFARRYYGRTQQAQFVVNGMELSVSN